MAIAAQRFKSLDQLTNVATVDFYSIKSGDVLNGSNSNQNSLTQALEAFLEKDKKTPLPTEKKDASERSSKSGSTVKDIVSLSDKDIDKMLVDSMSDNPLAQQAMARLSSSCKRKALNNKGFGKPFDPTLNCNGNKKKATTGACSSSQFSGVLNKLTSGQYNSSFNDLQNIYNNLVGLAGLGYKLNMCGVFGALAGAAGVDKNVASKAAGSVLSTLGSSSNLNGFVDLAAGAAGLHALKSAPNGVKNVYNNLKLPSDTKEASYKSTHEKLTLSSESFDSNWNKSKFDSKPSTTFIDKYNPDVDKVFKAGSLGSIDEDNLGLAPSNDMAFLGTAVNAMKAGNTSWKNLM